jgi:fructose-bisphosphate aldolase class 1
MNEKYIQAIILGSLIGGAILFDDYVKPEKERGMKKHMIIKKSDHKTGDISELEGIKELDLLQNMNVLEGLDLENLESLEDVDVQIKVEVKSKDKEEDQ